MRVLFAFVVLAVRTTVIRADGFLDVLSYLYRCRSRTFDECIERDLTRTIDDIMDKNDTYRLNRYLTMVVTSGNRNSDGNVARSHDLGTTLLDLFNALRIQYQPERSEDDFEGTMGFLLVFLKSFSCGISTRNSYCLKLRTIYTVLNTNV